MTKAQATQLDEMSTLMLEAKRKAHEKRRPYAVVNYKWRCPRCFPQLAVKRWRLSDAFQKDDKGNQFVYAYFE